MEFDTKPNDNLNEENSCENNAVHVTNDMFMPIKTKSRGLLKAVIIIAILAVIAASVVLFSGRSSDAVVRQYIKGMKNKDVHALISLVHEDCEEYLTEIAYNGDKSRAIASREEVFEEYEYMGIDLSLAEFRVVDTKEMSKEELQHFREFYSKAKVRIDEGKIYTIEMTVIVDGELRYITIPQKVIKIGTNWYLTAV